MDQNEWYYIYALNDALMPWKPENMTSLPLITAFLSLCLFNTLKYIETGQGNWVHDVLHSLHSVVSVLWVWWMNEQTHSKTHDGWTEIHPCPAPRVLLKKRKCSVALTTAPSHVYKALSQGLHNLTAASHRWRTSVLLNVCVHTCTYVHALWAALESTVMHLMCVLGIAHLCLYPAQWCSLPFRPSGPVTPLLPHQPVRSLFLLLLLSVFLALSQSVSHCELMNGPQVMRWQWC